MNRVAPAVGADLGSLSTREREVLAMIAKGLTNSQVAADIGVTVHAVKFHLASVYRKLGVANRTEAAFFYLSDLNERHARTPDPSIEQRPGEIE